MHSYLSDGELAGKSLLDIDSDRLDFGLDALRRGARRAVVLLPDPERALAARAAADSLGTQAEIIASEFEGWTTDERFDIVRCNALHQMYDPIHALRRMVELVRETVVLELAEPGFASVRAGHIGARALLARGAPAIFLGDPKMSTNVFLLTSEALRVFFNKHYACFEPIAVARVQDRTIVKARLRKIDTLTIVAGPTSSGKSTFVQHLCDDAALRRSHELGEISHVTSGNKLYALPCGELRHVLFHYDLLRPFGRRLRNYSRDPALTLLRAARSVNVFTIITPRDRLRAQLKEADLRRRLPRTRHQDGHQELYRRYGEPEFLRAWYERWFDFCAAAAVRRHTVVEHTGTYRFVPAQQWRNAQL